LALPLETFLENWLSQSIGLPMLVSVCSSPAELGDLTMSELGQFGQIRSTARADSWLIGRAALKKICLRSGLSPETSAIGFPNKQISLSHSGGTAVAIFCRSEKTSGIGIDFEIARPVRRESARFFLIDCEREYIEQLGDESICEELIRLWTVKEAIFKADPDNSSTGLREYCIAQPNAFSGIASIGGGRSKTFQYASVVLDSVVVSGAVTLVN